MEKHNIWAILRKLVALFFALTLLGVQGLQAKIAHKKEAFLQLSGDQYQRIASLHPDPNKPAFVSLKLQVARVGTLKVDLVASCGVPDAR